MDWLKITGIHGGCSNDSCDTFHGQFPGKNLGSSPENKKDVHVKNSDEKPPKQMYLFFPENMVYVYNVYIIYMYIYVA